MPKLLVTGGAGFIGSHFIRRFLRTHPAWNVVNLDKLTYAGNPENLKDVEKNSRYRFVQGDICDARLVGELLRDIQALVHFAAETHVDRSIDHDGIFLETNIRGVKVLLDAARRSKITRYLHISTDEVYGSLKEGEAVESSPLAPNSPYAASKASGDLFVRAYQNTFGLPIILIRPSNNFGPYQFPEKVIPLFITNLLENKKVPLYAKGENRRDWLFVEDHCEALDLIFEKGQPGETYNVAGGHELSNRELTNKILAIFEKGEEWIEYVADRPGHDFRYALKAEKIARLGFKPRHSFDEALKKTVQWYREHSDWWQPLRKDKFTIK